MTSGVAAKHRTENGVHEKECTKCLVFQPIENFRLSLKRGKRIPHPWCRACTAEYGRSRVKAGINREWYWRNREKVKATKRKHMYGITDEQYKSMLNAQGNCCKVCKGTYKLSVDHCHSSGKVRGILCDFCNNALGRVKDSKEILQKLIEYLDEH